MAVGSGRAALLAALAVLGLALLASGYSHESYDELKAVRPPPAVPKPACCRRPCPAATGAVMHRGGDRYAHPGAPRHVARIYHCAPRLFWNAR
jgi:hypothetical protein